MRLRPRRFALVLTLIGSLTVGLGLSYFVAMVEDTRAEMTGIVRERWQADYDIVVRPRKEMLRSAVDEIESSLNLLEANYLAAVPRGITLEQLDTIRSIPGVEVAAPVCMLGTSILGSCPDTEFVPGEPGVYRLMVQRQYSDGLKQSSSTDVSYYCVGEVFYSATYRSRVRASRVTCKSDVHSSLGYNDTLTVPLAAVDPEAEAQLVGLDRAVSGKYLTEAGKPYQRTYRREDPGIYLDLPVIVRSTPNTNYEHHVRIERLQLEPDQVCIDRINDVGADWLDTLPGQTVASYRATESDIHSMLLEKLGDRTNLWKTSIVHKTGPLNYQEPGPGGELRVEPVTVTAVPRLGKQVQYRWTHGQNAVAAPWVYSSGPHISISVLGLFDVDRLDVGRDPLTELPLETYRPAGGLLVRDSDGSPLAEPVRLRPVGYDLGLLTLPPLMLTTIDAARMLYGDDCISAVRVRVEGAATMSEEARRKIEWVAKEIFARTGLKVDVTIGSSPTRREVIVAGNEGSIPPLGYVELPFVEKNVHITIFDELNRGNLAVLAAVLLVAVLYAFAHAVAAVYGRLRDLATCRALGWRPGHIIGDTVCGSLVWGGLAALVGVGLSLVLAAWGGLHPPYGRLGLIGLTAVGVFAVGALFPALGASRVHPMLTMAAGEAGGRNPWTSGPGDDHRARVGGGASVFALVAGAFFGRWRRHLLTLLTLAVASSLLAAFILVTVRLRGVLCGNLLGEYLILEIGPRHTWTAVLCLGLAGLAVAELMSLNVSERRGELELLAALGWRPTTLQLLIAAEGALAGLAGGCLGVGLAVYALAAYYGAAAVGLIPPALAVLPVPVLTGFLGALLPALAVGGRPRGGPAG